MHQFQVPQFITVEDKVFGPFTIKQFLYVGAGAAVVVGARVLFQSFFFYPIAFLAGTIAVSFAFLKIDERPVPTIFKNALFYFLRPRLYIWKKEEARMTPAPEEQTKKPEVLVKTIPKLSESKLSDLAWSLDVKSGPKGKSNS